MRLRGANYCAKTMHKFVLVAALLFPLAAAEQQQRRATRQSAVGAIIESPPPSGDNKRCVPMLSSLSLGTSANGSGHANSNTGNITNSQQAQEKAGGEFVLAINDIDMPLGGQGQQAGAGNPLHSAMRFLSAFERQLYGDDEEEEEDEDEEEAAQSDESEQQQQQNGKVHAQTNSIKFAQNKLHLTGLNLTMLNVHLYNRSEPRFGLGVNVRNTTLMGRFHYHGPTPSLLAGNGGARDGSSLTRAGRSKLSGHYRMSIDNVLVLANSNLTKVAKQSAQLPFKLVTNEFRLNVSNLGYISIDILDAHDSSRPTSNYVLRMLQRVLQKTIKRIYYSFESTLIQTLEREAKKFLDCELTRFEPLLSASPAGPAATTQAPPAEANLSTSTSLEDLSRIVSSEVANLNLSKVALPDFDYQRQLLGTTASIYFTNGSLMGLDNFKLNGETKIKLQRQHLLVNASIGWFNMRPHYDWTLYLGNAASQRVSLARQDKTAAATTTVQDELSKNSTSGADKASSQGFVAFNIRAVDFDAVISKGLVPSSRVLVDELTIRRLDGPKMEFGGLPGMNRLTRGLVNFFMGRLKQRLVGSIQPALKRELEQILNKLPILNQI